MPIPELFQQIDLYVLSFINQQLANPVLDFIFTSAHYLSYAILAALVVYFALKKEKFLVVLMIATILISTASAAIMKTSFDRERPYQILDVRKLVEEDDNRSFPSNHAQLSFALSALVLFFHRRFGLALILLSVLMGLGRIYVGVHYPSDVLVGALIGALLALMVYRIGIRSKKYIRV